VTDETRDAAYAPREVVHELRQAARQQYGHDATIDEDLDGTKELKVEYRAAILLDRQADRIELLEATLRSIAAGPGNDESQKLAVGALEYSAESIPNAISTEDGDIAWVEVTPITETPEQALAALKANGMWTVEDDGTVYGYEVCYRTWMVPCVGQTERPLLTREALANVQYEDDVVYFELNDQRGCETGAWWWRCNESVVEPEGAYGD
jgi:hypothetical protein